MHLVAAPDKFRGSISAIEAADAIAAGADEVGWTCQRIPLADGGEGTLDVFGGPNRSSIVSDPLGNPVEARWRLDGDRAIIEMARASGLQLVGGKERNDPLRASTRGTGELIEAAIAAGARRLIVGVGGSATTDGGLGALEALAWRPFRSRGVILQVACDVESVFLDAARIFAPQKGADERQVEALAKRLRGLAVRYRDQLGVDVAALAGSGASGGLAGGLAALGAELAPGLDLIADALDLDAALTPAQLVITGEGLLDTTSFTGKVVGGVSRRAADRHLPVLAIAGEVAADVQGRIACISLTKRFGVERAWAESSRCITEATAQWLLARAAEPPTDME